MKSDLSGSLAEIVLNVFVALTFEERAEAGAEVVFVGEVQRGVSIHVLRIPARVVHQEPFHYLILTLHHCQVQQGVPFGRHWLVQVPLMLLDKLQDELEFLVVQNHVCDPTRDAGVLLLASPLLQSGHPIILHPLGQLVQGLLLEHLLTQSSALFL